MTFPESTHIHVTPRPEPSTDPFWIPETAPQPKQLPEAPPLIPERPLPEIRKVGKTIYLPKH